MPQDMDELAELASQLAYLIMPPFRNDSPLLHRYKRGEKARFECPLEEFLLLGVPIPFSFPRVLILLGRGNCYQLSSKHVISASSALPLRYLPSPPASHIATSERK